MVRKLTEAAAAQVVGSREAEGSRLQRDLEEHLQAIGEALVVVEAQAPERLLAERDRLRAAVAELTETHTVDEDRLAREIAYLAEKWDINEEIVRFRSHVELFREALQADASEPVGKRNRVWPRQSGPRRPPVGRESSTEATNRRRSRRSG